MERHAFLQLFLLIWSIWIIFAVEASVVLRRQKRIVGGIEAAQPPEDDPVIYVYKNDRNARIYGTRDPKKGFYVFRGIRFGEPPIGRSRFQRPRPVHLEGELDATKWGPPCPQPDKDNASRVVGTEDCLFLNVFTPALPDSGDGYPVLIWIHGGGFRRGAACQYEMRNLMKKKMVVVSIQYRLGSLGFLSTGSKELPGNNGMFDMILAVNWIKDYIEFFGGNPNRIIAFGHGTGASSAMMLSLSKLTTNYFSGLIAMSGSILSHFAIDKDPMSTAKNIASANNCPIDSTPEMVRCLQELPVENLIHVDTSIEKIQVAAQGFLSGLSTLLGAGPVIEGDDDLRSLPNFMTQTPKNALELGNVPEIPLLTGVLKDETKGAILGTYKSEVLKKLKIPNFLENDLVKDLRGTVAQFGNQTGQLIPNEFLRYFKVLDNTGAQDAIGKVAEVTSDVLFNAPAFLTVKHWSKRANTFLYSFDHVGKRSYGKDFLGGLPIVDAKSSDDGGTGHGDDLGYIFGRNSIFGDEIPDEKLNSDVVGNPEQEEEDERVTDVFTDMIAEFARGGKFAIPSATESGSLVQKIVPQFSGDSNPFVSITSTPQIMKNFRYCEMGAWTGITERLHSSACGIFQSIVEAPEVLKNPVSSMKEKFGGMISDIIPKKENPSAVKVTGNTEKKGRPFSLPNFGF